MTKRIWIVALVLVLSIVACQVPGLGPQAPAAPVVPAVVPSNDQPVSTTDSASPSTQQDLLVTLYEDVTPGIVAIQVSAADGSGALGSGFVYDGDGHIVTNYHVVEGASRVEVDFVSGYKTYGTVIGTDLDSDIAVIKVNAPAAELHPVALGDSSVLKVGQTVIAIGNPFGLNGTMTVGIISALGRTLDSAHDSPTGGKFTAGDVIQTDAAINPGNSGGPLFNTKGEVIGINRAIRTTNFTTSGEPINSGIGFAVSINIVKRVVPGLVSDGKYDYPYLGIASLDDLSLSQIEALGLKQFTGAYVTNAVPGGPADKAGVKAGTQTTNIPGLLSGGDLITAIDGHPVRRFDELLSYLITNKSPGDSVVLTLLRDGQSMDITVTLDKRP
jgi:S1-C subfamily serine protease